jgi:GNAT superfamily N-acetyltransferase
MSQSFTVRPIRQSDYEQWLPLWDGYNAFYERTGPTALPAEITASTWRRFFDPAEPVRALVAEESGKLIGLTHYIFHRSTARLNNTCYLRDLFTVEHARGRGVGRRLIEAVYEAARAAGCSSVYWQTHVSNATARVLYDKVASHQGFIVYSQDV